MPFSSEQISYAGKAAMDYIVKKAPEDIYNIDRPFIKMLQAGEKTFPGAKQYVNEKLRNTNDSNFSWFAPDGEVTYNRKRTLIEANFGWASCHDGFALTEEELLQNYISVTDNRDAAPTTDETKQFVNLITENTETLKLGFAEKFDKELHLDGTQSADAIPGLDLLVSTTPTTGTVGGIDRALEPLWRNYASLNIASTAGLLISEMEKAWRACIRYGGSKPTHIMCGNKFLDAYRVDAKAGIQVQVMNGPNGSTLNGGNENLTFKGIPLMWSPVMDDLEVSNAGGATKEWDKRCYFLNDKFLKLRPAQGQDMVTRKPPRAYNRYTHYWGLTWRGALTITRPSSMAVLTID